MMHIFLNGLGASAGAGLTYLYNVVPRLSSVLDVHTTLAVQPQLRSEFEGFANVTVLKTMVPAGTMRRFWFEQRELPHLVRDCGADILLSAGNFALRNSPVPQILLSGNSLYTSADFYRDLRRRREYRMWLDTKLKGYFAKESVHWADCTVAPSEAFAQELRRWTGKEVRAIYHGFDPEVFFRDNSPLPEEVQQKLASAKDCLRLLFVSHYNYYRNFETLFRALALLRERMPQWKMRLFLTCTLDDKRTPGTYRTGAAARLIRELDIREEVVELGAVPYGQMHHVYRACNIYVTAAYAETFAHPLVEAMACELPVIASDISVHREICQNATLFERFSPEDLATRIRRLADGKRPQDRWDAQRESMKFSWTIHVKALVAIAREFRKRKQLGNRSPSPLPRDQIEVIPATPPDAARRVL